MSPGSLGSFVLYSLYLGFQTSSLSTTYADYQRAVGAMQRLLDIMERQPAVVQVTPADPETDAKLRELCTGQHAPRKKQGSEWCLGC